MQPPDTLEVEHPIGIHARAQRAAPIDEPADIPSAESFVEAQSSVESLADLNSRESGPWLHYSSTPSYASLELDTQDGAPLQDVPSERHRKAPPKTFVVSPGALADLGAQSSSAPAALQSSSPSSPQLATGSTPPVKRRRRWLLFLFVTFIALIVGAGGLILGLHLWNTYRVLQGQ
jgi:hypothetical protein